MTLALLFVDIFVFALQEESDRIDADCIFANGLKMCNLIYKHTLLHFYPTHFVTCFVALL